MPLYNYKCPVCEKVRQEVHSMFDNPEFFCDSCDTSQEIKLYKSIQPVKATMRYGMRGDMRQYRADLARFRGDPRAFVDGPRALQKLIDQTQREGGEIRPLSEAFVPPPELEPDDNLLLEAQEEAIAELNEEV